MTKRTKFDCLQANGWKPVSGIYWRRKGWLFQTGEALRVQGALDSGALSYLPFCQDCAPVNYHKICRLAGRE